MLGYLRSRFPHIPTYCVMADTGFEHVRPVPAAEWSRQLADSFRYGTAGCPQPEQDLFGEGFVLA